MFGDSKQLKAIFQSQGWKRASAAPLAFKSKIIPHKMVLGTKNTLSPIECFKSLWSDDIHTRWIDEVKKNAKHNFKALKEVNKATTAWNYLGFHFFMCSERSESLRQGFKAVGVLKNHDVYEFIHGQRGAIDPFTLASNLSDNYSKYVNIGTHIAIDEIMAETSIDSHVVQTILRKPHPTGVLIFGASIKFPRGSPYMIRIAPKTEDYFKWPTHEVVQYLVEPLKTSIKHNFTMDSWFDSKEVKAYLDKKDQYWTIGGHTGRNCDFWIYAKEGLMPNRYNLYENPSTGQLASAFSDNAIHCCYSTAYRFMPVSGQKLERSPLSDCYKEHFNYVDLFNRKFYRYDMPLRAMTINSVLFDAILHITVLNAMVLYNNQDNVGFVASLHEALLPQ